MLVCHPAAKMMLTRQSNSFRNWHTSRFFMESCSLDAQNITMKIHAGLDHMVKSKTLILKLIHFKTPFSCNILQDQSILKEVGPTCAKQFCRNNRRSHHLQACHYYAFLKIRPCHTANTGQEQMLK